MWLCTECCCVSFIKQTPDTAGHNRPQYNNLSSMFSPMYGSSRPKKVNIEASVKLYYRSNVRDIHWIFHLTTKKKILFSRSWDFATRSLSKIECYLIRIICCIISDHNRVKLKINIKRNHRIHKHMEIEQQTFQYSVSHWNPGVNFLNS